MNQSLLFFMQLGLASVLHTGRHFLCRTFHTAFFHAELSIPHLSCRTFYTALSIPHFLRRTFYTLMFMSHLLFRTCCTTPFISLSLTFYLAIFMPRFLSYALFNAIS